MSKSLHDLIGQILDPSQASSVRAPSPLPVSPTDSVSTLIGRTIGAPGAPVERPAAITATPVAAEPVTEVPLPSMPG